MPMPSSHRMSSRSRAGRRTTTWPASATRYPRCCRRWRAAAAPMATRPRGWRRSRQPDWKRWTWRLVVRQAHHERAIRSTPLVLSLSKVRLAHHERAARSAPLVLSVSKDERCRRSNARRWSCWPARRPGFRRRSSLRAGLPPTSSPASRSMATSASAGTASIAIRSWRLTPRLNHHAG